MIISTCLKQVCSAVLNVQMARQCALQYLNTMYLSCTGSLSQLPAPTSTAGFDFESFLYGTLWKRTCAVMFHVSEKISCVFSHLTPTPCSGDLALFEATLNSTVGKITHYFFIHMWKLR